MSTDTFSLPICLPSLRSPAPAFGRLASDAPRLHAPALLSSRPARRTAGARLRKREIAPKLCKKGGTLSGRAVSYSVNTQLRWKTHAVEEVMEARRGAAANPDLSAPASPFTFREARFQAVSQSPMGGVSFRWVGGRFNFFNHTMAEDAHLRGR
jgi:hypothetical protein